MVLDEELQLGHRLLLRVHVDLRLHGACIVRDLDLVVVHVAHAALVRAEAVVDDPAEHADDV